jgi:hypothetical protein
MGRSSQLGFGLLASKPQPSLGWKKKLYIHLILEFLEIDNNILRVFKNELKMIFEYYS